LCIGLICLAFLQPLFSDESKETTSKKIAQNVLSENWYSAYMNGNKIMSFHIVEVETMLDNKKVYLTTTTTITKIPKNSRSVKKQWQKLTGEPIKTETFTQEDTQKILTTVLYSKTLITTTKTLNGKDSTKTLELTENDKLTNGLDTLYLKFNDPLKTGQTITSRSYDIESNKLHTTTHVIGEINKITHLGKEVEVFNVKSTSTQMPGITTNIKISKNCQMISSTMMGIYKMELTTKEESLTFPLDKKFSISSYIKMEKFIGIWEELDKLTVDISVDNDETGNIFKPSTIYHNVDKSQKGKYTLSFRRITAPTTSEQTLPLKLEGDDSKYVKPSLLIQSDDKLIQDKAKEIIKGEKNSLKVAKILCKWIYNNIGKESTKVSSASASETLKVMKGDCTEHSMLFCGFARSCGLPSRSATGLVLRGSVFGYHAWSEAQIDGKWIPVDATINSVGLPAGAILFGYDNNGEENPSITTGKLLGQTKLTLTSATIGNHTFDPRKDNEVRSLKENVYTDKSNGFSFDQGKDIKLSTQKNNQTVFFSTQGDSINIFMQPGRDLSKEKSLKVRMAEILKGMQATLIEEGKATYCGHDAWRTRSSVTQANGNELLYETMFFRQNLHHYLIVVAAKKELFSTREKEILEHFKRFKLLSKNKTQ